MNASKIGFVAALNAAIVAVQILVGLYANSTALITDALHNFGDVLALIVSLFAFKLGSKPVSQNMTFGYVRAEMMATFINSLFLCASMIFIFFEAIGALFHPEAVKPIPVMIAALVGIAANGLGAWMLGGHGHSHSSACGHNHNEDLNIRSSFLHLLGDAVVSVGVALSALAIWLWNVSFIDAFVSILISVYIFKEGYSLLKTSFFSLIDANSDDLDEVCTAICQAEAVHSVHDVHIYRPSSKEAYLSAHVVFDGNPALTQVEQNIETIRYKLKKIGVTHIVLQPESVKYAQDSVLCAVHH